jgi:Sigma-70 region 2
MTLGWGESQPDFAEQWLAAKEAIWKRCLWRTDGHVQDAEDLLQLTAVKAFRGYRSFRGDASFRTWACVIAERVADDAFEVRLRRARREEPLDADRHAPAVAGPDEAVLDGDAWVRAAIAAARSAGALKPAEAGILLDRLNDPDSTWAEFGAKYGKRGEACAQRHGRAVTTLRMVLMVGQPELFGGLDAIAAACGRAGLTPAEESAFHAVVLDGRPRRRRGTESALRSACHKVVRALGKKFPPTMSSG